MPEAKLSHSCRSRNRPAFSLILHSRRSLLRHRGFPIRSSPRAFIPETQKEGGKCCFKHIFGTRYIRRACGSMRRKRQSTVPKQPRRRAFLCAADCLAGFTIWERQRLNFRTIFCGALHILMIIPVAAASYTQGRERNISISVIAAETAMRSCAARSFRWSSVPTMEYYRIVSRLTGHSRCTRDFREKNIGFCYNRPAKIILRRFFGRANAISCFQSV